MNDTDIQHTPFVKQLAANDRPTRDAAVASLKLYLASKRTFTRLEFLKLWKGLFYCMWMSDRPRTQQNLANELASLMDVLQDENVMLFLDVFWTTMAREWNGIDVLRMDKFLLLVRRYLAASFRRLDNALWNEKLAKEYMTILETVPLHPTNNKIPNGLRYHITDIYLDELEKFYPDPEAGDEKVEPPINILMKPFETLIAQSPTKPVRLRVKEQMNDERMAKWGYTGALGGQLPKSKDEGGDIEGNEEAEEWNGMEE